MTKRSRSWVKNLARFAVTLTLHWPDLKFVNDTATCAFEADLPSDDDPFAETPKETAPQQSSIKTSARRKCFKILFPKCLARIIAAK